MESIWLKGLLGGVIGLSTYLFGGFDAVLAALLALIAIDFITGIIKSVILKNVSSLKMFEGGAKKIGILLIVAVANIVDNALDMGSILRAVTISYFIANEGISILENWSMLGLPIPQRLKDILAQVRKDERPKPENTKGSEANND